MRLECQHFLSCIRDRTPPLTDGRSALAVLKVLEASQHSLDLAGKSVSLADIESGVSA
jgi:predicted dehydrogenase